MPLLSFFWLWCTLYLKKQTLFLVVLCKIEHKEKRLTTLVEFAVKESLFYWRKLANDVIKHHHKDIYLGNVARPWLNMPWNEIPLSLSVSIFPEKMMDIWNTIFWFRAKIQSLEFWVLPCIFFTFLKVTNLQPYQISDFRINRLNYYKVITLKRSSYTSTLFFAWKSLKMYFFHLKI